MCVLFRELKSVDIIKAFLNKFSFVISFQQIAWQLVYFIIAARDVMVGQRMVKFRVVDKVDASDSSADFVGVLPSCLLFQNVSVWVL